MSKEVALNQLTSSRFIPFAHVRRPVSVTTALLNKAHYINLLKLLYEERVCQTTLNDDFILVGNTKHVLRITEW